MTVVHSQYSVLSKTSALCAMLFAVCFPAQAQQPKNIPLVGFLVPGSPSSYSARIEAFLQGLRELGYVRSEEHTSELQSLAYLVCRLLLEKKNTHECTPVGHLPHLVHPPDDLRHIVVRHLYLDHVAGLFEFPPLKVHIHAR